MEGPSGNWRQNRWMGGLAGFELGVLGGLLMLGWYALFAPIIGQPWWAIPNLLASNYFSHAVLRAGPGFPTLAGGAFQLVGAAVIGAVVGFVLPVGRLGGVAVAGAWYLGCYFYLWPKIAPFAHSYTPQILLMAGFFVFGSTLGYHRTLLQRRLEAGDSYPEILETLDA
jgi:hypothetical protein